MKESVLGMEYVQVPEASSFGWVLERWSGRGVPTARRSAHAVWPWAMPIVRLRKVDAVRIRVPVFDARFQRPTKGLGWWKMQAKEHARFAPMSLYEQASKESQA